MIYFMLPNNGDGFPFFFFFFFLYDMDFPFMRGKEGFGF